MVVPHLRTVPPLAARCSVSAHCASLRVLATSALRAFGRSQARLRLSLVPTIRNSRLAALPLAILLCSLDFRFACFRHWRRRSSVPIGLTPRCFAHRARASCAPLAAPPLSPSLGLLRPVSRTARGLRAPHWLRRLFRPHWAYYGLFRALRATSVRPTGCAASFVPLTQGSLWGAAATEGFKRAHEARKGFLTVCCGGRQSGLRVLAGSTAWGPARFPRRA